MKLNKKALLLLAAIASHAFGQSDDAFKIKDIKIQGLKRVASGAVFIHVPVEVGETIETSQIRQLIKNLYASQNFDAVEIHRQDDVLLIVVRERPTISKVVFKGNELIKTELLETSLQTMGIGQGELLNSTKLTSIEKALQELFYSRGLYNAKVYAQAVELPRNRVELQLEFMEGEPASIAQINFVGNQKFTDAQLRDLMRSSDELSWWEWFGHLNYEKEVLEVDREAIQAFYQNQGYIRFQIRSTEVSISPDKTKIYVTMNLNEGEQYTVDSVDFYGDIQELKLETLSSIESKQRYQVKQVTSTEMAIKEHLANLGFEATVTTTPIIDDKTKTVKLNIFVETGSKTYVRQINFSGNSNTKDTVLRREMRQLEGSALNQADLETSKVRLQRLGFFQQVEYKLIPVAGQPELVDVLFSVREQNSGGVSVGAGYGTSFFAKLAVSQKNFLGTGVETMLALNKSDTLLEGQLALHDPYYFDNGASLGVMGMVSRQDTTDIASIVDYKSNQYAGEVSVGFPVNEYNRYSVSVGVESFWLQSAATYEYMKAMQRMYGDTISFDNVLLGLSWQRNTLDRYLFPTSGSFQTMNVKASVPSSDLDYYSLSGSTKHYIPLNTDRTWVFSAKLSANYIDTYGMEGNKRQLLPYQKFVMLPARGFMYLGPRAYRIDNNKVNIDTKILGGNAYYLGALDVIFPLPFLADDLKHRFRTSFFMDIGSIWNSKLDTSTLGNLPPEEQDKISEYSNPWRLKASLGFSIKVFTPLGLIGFDFAKAVLKDKHDQEIFFGFNFGQDF